jgi:hypothetical protein
LASPIEFADFCSPAYRMESPNIASSQMINIYCEVVEKGPRTGKLRIRGIPGLKLLGTLPDLPVRGLISTDGGNRLFAVAGSTVYEVFSDGSWQAQQGTINVNASPVTIAYNGFQFAIASGGLLYILNGANGKGNPGTVTQVGFSDGSGPVQAATVDFLDQYFIVNQVNTAEIFISNLAPAGATWDPGDTAYKEGYSDPVARVFCDNEQLWLFGFETTEIWTDTGNLFPFGRIQQAVLKFGCSAPYSVAGALGYRFWLWRGAVYAAYGLNPDRISDYGVEQAISTYGDTSNAEGWCYVDGGHLFYVLSFPSVGQTWVFDTATAPGPVGPVPLKAWHQRMYWSNGQWSQYRGRCHAFAFNSDIVGDPLNGNFYILDKNTFTDAGGVALRRQRICPYITENMRKVRYDRLVLDMDTGVGLSVPSTALGYNPQVIMRYSGNRGKTWSNERQAPIGQLGFNNQRVAFRQLGSSYIGHTFDVVVTDPVPVAYNTAYLQIGQPEVGR